MDTSPEYVKMCEKAVEIQDMRGWLGQFTSNIPNIFYPTWETYSKLWCLTYEQYQAQESDYRNLIWLPRQDQLQEMLIPPYKNFLNLYFFFNDFITETFIDKDGDIHDPIIFTSMEQTWLGFVMKEKYRKTWDGNEWVHYKVATSTKITDGKYEL